VAVFLRNWLINNVMQIHQPLLIKLDDISKNVGGLGFKCSSAAT
jgi:hypothetical protein